MIERGRREKKSEWKISLDPSASFERRVVFVRYQLDSLRLNKRISFSWLFCNDTESEHADSVKYLSYIDSIEFFSFETF